MPQQVQLLIDSMSATPVIALSRRLDLLAANALGRALFDVIYASPARGSATSAPNLAYFVFLDPAAGDFYADIDHAGRADPGGRAAATCVKILRAQAGSTPHDERLTQPPTRLNSIDESDGASTLRSRDTQAS